MEFVEFKQQMDLLKSKCAQPDNDENYEELTHEYTFYLNKTFDYASTITFNFKDNECIFVDYNVYTKQNGNIMPKFYVRVDSISIHKQDTYFFVTLSLNNIDISEIILSYS